jgi:hypothetical protein
MSKACLGNLLYLFRTLAAHEGVADQAVSY